MKRKHCKVKDNKNVKQAIVVGNSRRDRYLSKPVVGVHTQAPVPMTNSIM